MSDVTLDLACELIRRHSVSPDDQGCQRVLTRRLKPLGFHCEPLRFGEVDNLWARLGDTAPLVCFAGHTDVVPTGPRAQWSSDPFEPTLRDGRLYGRGAADMKGGLAAMITAAEAFVRANRNFKGSLAFLITSDEENEAVDGTKRVIETLQARGEHIDYCIVGEPSSALAVGDAVRIGRRGSINGRLTVRGIQGHVAYPEKLRNPIHLAAPALAELARHEWDAGTEHFPATTLQFTNVTSGTGADNVVPGTLDVQFNLRYSAALTDADIRRRVAAILDAYGFDYELQWRVSGQPFLTQRGELTRIVSDAIRRHTGLETELSTAGGTSDGRFIAPTGSEVVELGPVNETIHRIDEFVEIAALATLHNIYLEILQEILPAG